MEVQPKITNEEQLTLSDVEKSVILRMRSLQPFQRIEIKLNENRLGEISVVTTSTVREIFVV